MSENSSNTGRWIIPIVSVAFIIILIVLTVLVYKDKQFTNFGIALIIAFTIVFIVNVKFGYRILTMHEEEAIRWYRLNKQLNANNSNPKTENPDMDTKANDQLKTDNN